jgi:hypothetical protein
MLEWSTHRSNHALYWRIEVRVRDTRTAAEIL